MAKIAIEDDQVVLRLSRAEKVEGLHGDLRAPLSALRGVDVLEDAMGAVHGMRMPGTGVPGFVAVGTYVDQGTRTFAVVHHGNPRGVRICFGGADYDDWVIGCADPDGVAASLSTPST